MKKPLLFLHAGIPKTGSTALQVYFVKHAQEMLEQGLYYPDIGTTFSEVFEDGLTSGNAYSLSLIYQEFADNNDDLIFHTEHWIKKIINESQAFSFKAMLLSSEQLSTLTRSQWGILEDALSVYFDLRLIAFTREPYSWVFSTWLQSVKGDGLSQWLGSSVPQRDFLPLILPHLISDTLLSKTIQLSYEECKSDIIGAFFSAIDYSVCNTDGNVKIIDEINSSLTDQELTLILLINRLIKGNSYLCKKIYSTLLNQSKDLPCYFYSPKVDGMIDEFFVANKVKRQSLCIKRDPVVESERSWFESHYFSGALMQSVFIEVTDYYENIYKPIDRAKFRADEYYNSIFRMQIPDNFDVVAYLLINTDILFEGIDPYKHYLEYGREEGREFNFGQ